ncbi:MAG: mcpB 6 [Deltaproteobacteria bacterium]|nr:mcpB 6 [Deltaproteobacteria bacterium]
MKISDRLKWSSFSGKLFIILASASAGAIILLTFVWIAYAWIAIDETVHRDLKVIAERTAGEIEEYLSGRIETVIGMKELLSYPDEDRFKLALMLKRIELELNQYSNISIFDASNKIVASSRPDSPASIPGEIFGIVKGGKVYRSPLLFTQDNLPYMTLAVPLFWQGEVFRILVSDIDVIEVWNKVDGIKIGDTGRASIISEVGGYLADEDKTRVLYKQNLKDYFSLKKELTGNDGVENVRNWDGNLVSLAQAEIPSTGWNLIIMQDHWESMHFLFVMAYQAGFIMLAALLITYYASTRISRKFAQPIEELHKGIE